MTSGLSYPPSYPKGQVRKLHPFKGARALYLYLPPQFSYHQAYPVIYMHDGQNCFEAFVQDSFSGSWRADEVADRLIHEKLMQPAIIVAISNGQQERLAEYLPPYVNFRLPAPRDGIDMPAIQGKADELFEFYLKVEAFLQTYYPVLKGREHRATCGSSMGGLFSTYLAWEQPDFAKHHAALSPSYWVTNDGTGHLLTLERIKNLPKRDIRLWLDSGEGTSNIPGKDDDNKFVTMEAREALLAAGYVEGVDFYYHLEKGARHSEAAWAKRLDRVFNFLLFSNSHKS
ncbi:MAG: alpha/beta hydrolase-fold protein [Deinococcales bacterium]